MKKVNINFSKNTIFSGFARRLHTIRRQKCDFMQDIVEIVAF